MKNPFQVLDLPDNADDETVKKTYLRLVRQYPPDREPERFQEIRTAYEAVASKKDRLRFQLFQVAKPDVSRLCQALFENNNPQRPSEQMVIDALTSGIKTYHLATPSRQPSPAPSEE